MDPQQPKRHNEKAWDHRARTGQRFTNPADSKAYESAAQVLSQQAWLEGGVKGKSVLLLASGGGGQSGLFASQGAKVTVVDISSEILKHDRELARQEHFDIRVMHTSMDDLSGCMDSEFDLVIHPVSTCYVWDVRPVYREVARVCKAGGVYISHHKQPACLNAAQFPESEGGYRVELPQDQNRPLPEVKNSLYREEGTLEFAHSYEHLLGEMCRSGFSIEDVIEPQHGDKSAPPGDFKHRSRYLPPFISIKARRREKPKSQIIL